MISCLNRDYDSVELLLDSDADPNVKDQISGRTALFHAAELYDGKLTTRKAAVIVAIYFNIFINSLFD